jgi:tetratricopeptide (TPR) repeat protein
MFRTPSEQILSILSQRDRTTHPFFRIPSSTLEKGRKLLSKGEYAQALALFTILIEKNPQNEWAWHGRGDAFQLLEAYEQAENAYRKATERNPNESLHWGGLANALFGQKKEIEAQKIWIKAQRIDPSIAWMRPN